MKARGAGERNRGFPLILLVVFLLTTAIFAVRPMVSYRALEHGAGVFDLGVITASYALLSLVAAVPLGQRVDRWGEPRFIVAGTALIAATCLALVWITATWALALSQAALGLGQIMSVIGAQALVANTSGPGRQDARFGIFTVLVSLGQLAGPATAGLLAGGGVGEPVDAQAGTGTTSVFTAAFVLTTLASVAALVLSWRLHVRERAKLTEETRSTPTTSVMAFRRVIRVPSMPQAMIASLTVLSSIDLLTAYLPAYGEAHGLSVETVGFMLSTRAAASLVSRLGMLPLIALLGRRLLLVISMVLPAVALSLFPFSPGLALQYAAIAVIGLGLGLGQPITISWVASRAPREVRGTALGVRLSGNRLGQAVLPLVVGGLAGATGLVTVFVSLAVMLSVSAIFVMSASFGVGNPSEDDFGSSAE